MHISDFKLQRPSLHTAYFLKFGWMPASFSDALSKALEVSSGTLHSHEIGGSPASSPVCTLYAHGVPPLDD